MMRVAFVLLLATATASAYTVRIADSDASNPLRGRVEVYNPDTSEWGTVCDDSFDNEDATVLCRMLGYSGGIEVPNTDTPDGSGNINLDDLQCTGAEASVWECPHTTRHNCGHAEDAGIDCSVADVRLVDEELGMPFRGRLEVKHPETAEWGTVCDDVFDNNDNGANVVCRTMGYQGGRLIRNNLVPDGTLPILLDNVQCSGTEAHFFDCPANQWGDHNCGHSEDTGVECFVDGCRSDTPFRACDGSCFVDTDQDGFCDQEDDANSNQCLPDHEPVENLLFLGIPGTDYQQYVSTTCYPVPPHNHDCSRPDSQLGGRDVWVMNYDAVPVEGSIPSVCHTRGSTPEES